MNTKKRRTALEREEWDFSNVSDVRYCCLYEYAREAERQIWDIAKRRRDLKMRINTEYDDRPCPPELFAEFLKENALTIKNGSPFTRFQNLGITDFSKIDLRSDLPYYDPPPWQKLTDKQRESVVVNLQTCYELRPSSRAVSLLDWAPTPDLDRAFAIGAGLRISIPNEGDFLAGLTGSAAVALNLDLRNRTNAEIIKEFENLLIGLRSGLTKIFPNNNYQGPGKKGAKFDSWQRNLDNLGLMRIRHAYSPSGMDLLLREEKHRAIPWKNAGIDSATGLREVVDKRRERVLEKFRELFPEAGPNAFPERWKTASELGKA
jgi:hypothetical protein